MTDSELIQAVDAAIVEAFEIAPERLKPEANIFADLGLDSLDVVDLVAVLQKKFGVTIRDDERIRSVRTIQDLHQYLLTIQAEQRKS